MANVNHSVKGNFEGVLSLFLKGNEFVGDALCVFPVILNSNN